MKKMNSKCSLPIVLFLVSIGIEGNIDKTQGLFFLIFFLKNPHQFLGAFT
jgi:hypothetical protein